MHAITMPHQPIELRKDIFEMAKTLLACGLDPKFCTLYQQSSVSSHAELAWILSCITPKSWLETMTQYKDKSKKGNAGLGLYSYPVLMAADILIFCQKRQVFVPVGDDQRQHLELASDITKRFNDLFEKEFFTLPIPVYTQIATRIMNLRDGKSKMSKSDPLDSSRINLLDNNDEIAKKIRKSITDSEEGICYNHEKRPQVSNLIDIYSSFEDITPDKVVEIFQEKNIPYFKKQLTEVIQSHIGKINQEYERISKDPEYVKSVLEKGKEEANELTHKTIQNIKSKIGF